MSLLLAVDPDSGSWRPPIDDNEPVFRIRVERAKSGAATCRLCGDKIPSNTWRVGIPIKWRTFISSWHHPKCFYMKEVPINIDAGEVYGWESIEDPDELSSMAQELAKTEPPAHLGGEVNVEDDGHSFLSSAKKAKVRMPRLPAPESMTVKLLPFQEEGHAWMLEREANSREKGGILADEMGLGKTIQTISLLVSDKKKSGKKMTGPTLIVAPSSAMHQWQEEIARCTREGTLSVFVYQSGKRKACTPADILGYDVVLTSYPILESEYRRAVNSQKVVCVYCDRKFLARKLIPHHKYFCGPEAERTARLKKTEKKRAETTQKAMRTLRIGASAPTPTAIYRDLMIEAGRTPSSMLATAKEAQKADSKNRDDDDDDEDDDDEIFVSKPKETPKSKSRNRKKMIKDESEEEEDKDQLEAVVKLKGNGKGKKTMKSSDVSDDDDTKKPQRKAGKISPAPKPFSQEAEEEEKSKDDDDVEEEEVVVQKTTPKRKSALDARSKFKPEQDIHSNVWYCVDVGLFWKISDKQWLSVDGKWSEVADSASSLVLKQGESLVRLSDDSMEMSTDGGENWNLHTSEDASSLFVSPMMDDEEAEGWKTSGKFVGQVVARKFDDNDIIGLIVARLDEEGSDPLWHVRHVDGDTEDLDQSEVTEGIKEAKKTNLSLKWLKPSLKKKKVVFDISSSSSSSESDDDESSLDDSDDDSDDVEVVEDSDDEVKIVSTTTSTTSPAAAAMISPNFVPQTWDADNIPEECVLAVQKKKKKKIAPKPSSSKKGKKKAADEADDDEDDDENPFIDESEEEEEEAFVKEDSIYAPAGDVVDEDLVDLNRSLLHCIGWHRIILDEAHKIKERTNSTAKSVFALRGNLSNEAPPFPSIDTSTDTSHSKKSKDPNAPKRPKTAYLYFREAKVPQLKAKNEFTAKEITQVIIESWKSMKPEEMRRYDELAAKDRARYDKEMKSYTPPEDEEEGEEEDIDNKKKKKLNEANESVLYDNCRRWALTGTPLMNRLGDLYSLVRFLRVSPYSYYFCKKDCTCRMLQWSFGWDAKYCLQCGHTPMSHYSYFNKTIMNPVNRNGYVGIGKKAMLLLRDELLGSIMLRRTKQERKDDLNLPPLTIETVELHLSSEETDFYESIYKLSQSRFDTFVAKGTVMNNYAHVFQLLSRLRQAADHPYLIVAASEMQSKASGSSDLCGICMLNVDDVGTLAVAKCRHTFHRECIEKYVDEFEEKGARDDEDEDGKKKKKKKTKKSKNDDGEEEGSKKKSVPTCPTCYVPLTVTLKVHGGNEEGGVEGKESDGTCVICFDRPRTALILPCGHAYMCYECATGLENRTCPVCRSKIEKVVRSNEDDSSKKKKPLFGRKSILQKLKLEEFHSSSKLDAVIKEVKKVVESPSGTEKIIVFSQFTTFLDLIQWRLQAMQISGVVKLVGSLSQEERKAVLKAFKTDSKVNVILMSLKAGGEGLNLQEATVVISCDPWWNPSVELQAFHRAHRIGQTRPVKAIRFVTKKTIEERMVELQEKKSLIFEGTVDGNESSLSKLTQEDLRFLFQR